MQRVLGLVAAAILLVGCRAPLGSPDLFGTGASRRIPPPGTGSIGQPAPPNVYYQQPQGAATSPGFTPPPNLGYPNSAAPGTNYSGMPYPGATTTPSFPANPAYPTTPAYPYPYPYPANAPTNPSGPSAPLFPGTQPYSPASPYPGTGTPPASPYRGGLGTVPTTIPPAAASRSNTAAVGTGVAPASASVPPPATRASGGGWVPAGTSNMNGSPASAETAAASRSATVRSIAPVDGEDGPIRIVEPSRVAAATAPSLNGMPLNGAAAAEPRRFEPPANLIEIAPEPRADPAAGYAPPSGGRLPVRGFRRLDAAATSTTSTTTAPTSAAGNSNNGANAGTSSQYSHARDYSVLRGRLEHSQASRRWKLRYISATASADQIDDYGGSVELAPSPLLAGFESGDFVVAQGAIGTRNADASDYAPLYLLTRLGRAE
jgi:hypothetical protein